MQRGMLMALELGSRTIAVMCTLKTVKREFNFVWPLDRKASHLLQGSDTGIVNTCMH